MQEIGHVAPEATDGGPISLVETGDKIKLDLNNRKLDLLVDEKVLEKRKANWKPAQPRYTTGVLGKYSRLVGTSSKGAVCN